MKELSNDKWVEIFFTVDYWKRFMQRSAQTCLSHADIILSLVAKDTHTKHGLRVLDACSGVGDVACAMAYRLELSKSLESLDCVELSAAYSAIAQDNMQDRMNSLCMDIFEYLPNFPNSYNLVYNWYSSWGYFSHEKNNLFLAQCFDALKSDGVFLLETMNALHVKENFKSSIVYPANSYNTSVVRSSVLDTTEQFTKMNQNWKWIEQEGAVIRQENTTIVLYSPEQIKDMLTQCGFSDIEVFAIDNANIGNKENNLQKINLMDNAQHPRLIFVAKKY